LGMVTLRYQMSERISIAFFNYCRENKNCATALVGHRAAILFNYRL